MMELGQQNIYCTYNIQKMLTILRIKQTIGPNNSLIGNELDNSPKVIGIELRSNIKINLNSVSILLLEFNLILILSN